MADVQAVTDEMVQAAMREFSSAPDMALGARMLVSLEAALRHAADRPAGSDDDQTHEELDLDAIAARAEAATRGTWRVTRDPLGSHVETDLDHMGRVVFGSSHDRGPDRIRADADFIARARTDVRALVAEVERLRAYVDACTAREFDLTAAWLAAGTERDEARSVLGAVAALADEWRKYHDDSHPNAYTIIYGDAANMLHRRLAPVFGAVETAADGHPIIPAGSVVATSTRPYRQGTALVAVSESEWEEAEHAMGEVPQLEDALADANAAAVSGAVAKPDDERDRWQAVSAEVMEHLRSVGSNISDTYVAIVMSEVWKRRKDLIAPLPVAKHEQEVRASTGERIAQAIEKRSKGGGLFAMQDYENCARIARADALTEEQP